MLLTRNEMALWGFLGGEGGVAVRPEGRGAQTPGPVLSGHAGTETATRPEGGPGGGSGAKGEARSRPCSSWGPPAPSPWRTPAPPRPDSRAGRPPPRRPHRRAAPRPQHLPRVPHRAGPRPSRAAHASAAGQRFERAPRPLIGCRAPRKHVLPEARSRSADPSSHLLGNGPALRAARTELGAAIAAQGARALGGRGARPRVGLD